MRALICIVTFGGVVAAGCAAAVPAPSANPLQKHLIATVTGAGAITHLQALQRIADQHGGNRASPSPGYEASVDYVAAILRRAGYEVTTPTFTMDDAPIPNVIAQTRTGSREQVVMAGAHLDSVPQGPGINDNGSGVAALLEIAVKLGGSPPVSHAIRFAFWGAEEEDLVGSTHYVETLPNDERDRIALYLNLDVVASPNPAYLVQGGKGRGSASGPDGSGTVAQVLVDQLTSAGVSAERTEFIDDSDYAPFIEADIPSGGVWSGDYQRKTTEQAARWGGRADDYFDPCYHTACDRLDNIDPTTLDRFTDAVAGTITAFAVTTDSVAR